VKNRKVLFPLLLCSMGLASVASAAPVDISDIITDATAQLDSVVAAVLPWAGALALAYILFRLIKRFVK